MNNRNSMFPPQQKPSRGRPRRIKGDIDEIDISILGGLRNIPPMTVRELGRLVDREAPTIHYRLGKLIELGLVEHNPRLPPGAARSKRLTAMGLKVLEGG